MKRTYGRKNSRRSRPDIEDTLPPRKRLRIEVEIVRPKSSVSPPPSIPISHVSPPRATSPIRRNATLPDIGTMSGNLSSMRTPTKPAQSLSTLFPTAAHQMPRSPGISLGVVKRMLSRSRTESSIDCNASHNLFSFTPPSNTFPVNHSPPKRPTSSSPVQTQNELLPTKHARTYAGASRSYLMALPAVDSVESDDTRESYSDLRSRWGIDNSEDYPRSFDDDRQLKRTHNTGSLALPNGMPNDVKSITELRSKGESRRFLDEVGYLFEGIETGCAIALRRASVLEIVSKLCDSDFNRRAKISDFYTRTWDIFIKARGEGPDKVLDATLSFFAFFSTRDPQTLSELAHKPDFVPTLLDILNSFSLTSDMKRDGLNQGLRKDVLALALLGLDAPELKAAGIIRTDVAPLKSLVDIIAKSGVVKDVRGISIRTLLSTTLSSLPPSLLPPALQTLPPILNSLRAELRLVPPRVSAWERGLKLFPGGEGTSAGGNGAINDKGKERQKSSIDIATPSLAHIHACLHVLDTYLMEECHSRGSNRGSESREEGVEIHCALVNGALLDDLVELCVATEILVRECVRDLDAVAMDEGRENSVKQDIQDECESELARKTLFSTLRILTLLPASACSSSYRLRSCTHPSPAHSDTLWTPSNTALSLVMRVVLRAQVGWVGSLRDGRGKGEEEQPQRNEDYTVETRQPEDTDTSSPPLGFPRELSCSSEKQRSFPVLSPPRSTHKKISPGKTNVSTKTSGAGVSNDEGTRDNTSGERTPIHRNGRGKGERRLVSSSVPAYSLTWVESFDLLCLALGLLLNWTSGEGNAASEKMRRVLLNPACFAARNCTRICTCPSSSQMPLLSCLVSVYQSYRGTDSLLQKRNILPDHARKSTSDADRNPSSTVQKQSSHSASGRHAYVSYPKPLPSQPTLNTRSIQFQSPGITFLAGYTAVLLGLIYTSTSPRDMRVRPTPAVQSLIRGDALLESLIVDARNFVALYDDIEEELNGEGSIMHVDGELDMDMGSDVEGFCSMGLRQGEKGRGKALEKRNEDVARGVLEALEALRDEQS